MTLHSSRFRNILRTLLAVGSVALYGACSDTQHDAGDVGAGEVSAGDQAPTAEAAAALTQNGCMADVAGQTLNCTANDVRIARVSNISVPSCTLHQPVTFTATFEVELTATTRYDIGLYLSRDGDPNNDGALTGLCTLDTPTAANAGTSYVDLDGDGCGDIDAAHRTELINMTVTTVCEDDDGNGLLDLPNCTSWRQPGQNTVCANETQAFPGSKSKCNCDKNFDVNIEVETPTITVTKAASPTAVKSGDTVSYTVVVTNTSPTSTITLTSGTEDPNINDTTQPIFSILSNCGKTVLAAGESTNCNFTATVTGAGGASITDEVCFSGHNGQNFGPVCAQATVTIKEQPTITVTKTANPTQVNEPGGQVSYTVLVTNTSTTSTVTLTSVTEDANINDATPPFSILANCGTLVLAPGASTNCNFTANVTGNAGDSITDKVCVNGHNGLPIPETCATANVTILNVPPTGTVAKNATSIVSAVVRYSVLVTNTSFESVTLESLNDSSFGNITTVQGDVVSACALPAGTTLAPNGTFTCNFDAIVRPPFPHNNTVTALLRDNDNSTVSPTGSASVTVSLSP